MIRAKQNYAHGIRMKAHIKYGWEDSASIEEKLKLIKQNKLAGVAEWKLGWENAVFGI